MIATPATGELPPPSPPNRTVRTTEFVSGNIEKQIETLLKSNDQTKSQKQKSSATALYVTSLLVSALIQCAWMAAVAIVVVSVFRACRLI